MKGEQWEGPGVGIKVMGLSVDSLSGMAQVGSQKDKRDTQEPCFLFFFFWGVRGHTCGLWHMEVSELGVEWELQLLAYATATATRDPSQIYNLHYSS